MIQIASRGEFTFVDMSNSASKSRHDELRAQGLVMVMVVFNFTEVLTLCRRCYAELLMLD